MKLRHVAGLSLLLGCNATAAQLQQTAADSLRLGGCIIGMVLNGNTDPGQIGGQCAGAAPAVIVDVINDVEAKSLPAAGAALSPEAEQRLKLLEEAKAKAVAALAAPGIQQMTVYAIVNEAKAPELALAWLLRAAGALNQQHDVDFAPQHGTLPISVVVASELAQAPAKSRILHLVDQCDDPGALAYHTRDDNGRPVLQLGVETIRSQGGVLLDEISKAMSHEILETEGNPYVARWNDFDGKRKLALEVCDPVQGSSYRVDGVAVSSFVLPSFFDPDDRDGPWDKLGELSGPLTCHAGGYLAFDDGTQTFGELVTDAVRAHVAERSRVASKRKAA